MASKTWFDKLSAEDQKIIREAAEEARQHGSKMEDEKDAFYAVELKKKGMEFITPDNAGIRAKAMPAIERALKKLDPEVATEVDRLSK